MKAAVVGYGSIGSRHVRILRELGQDVAVVSARQQAFPAFTSLAQLLASSVPDYVVIANASHQHYETLVHLADVGFGGRILVEKPLFNSVRPLTGAITEGVFVGYNLRFHPVLQRVRELLVGQTAISAQVYVGQYLPEWRSGMDYRASYSAQRACGGGALRDLSHELDYCTWLLGRCTALAAVGGHHSSLEISSDDVFALLLRTENCPVITIQMNYLDRVGRRELLINTDRHTLRADLIMATVEVDGAVEHFTCERDDTYRRQHEAVLGNKTASLCTINEGLSVVALIEAAERAAAEGCWVAAC